MKPYKTAAIVLVVSLILSLTGSVVARELGPEQQNIFTSQTTSDPLTLNFNLGGEPSTLDPAVAEESRSLDVIEQLFIGLVKLDDNTGEVRPELATSWIASPDSTVYTFTLRSDAVWSDGHPVTAQDVRYGILRSLTPTTLSSYAYVLTIIKNAEAYYMGTITDPNQVGVTALDNTHLRITFEYPASYALSILAMWVARPMPQWAIEASGSPTWTLPANIVTSGPYRLAEWVHNGHILLTKNPSYYDAANVQIDQVKAWMVDEATAWTMYLNGQLDTAALPLGTSLDPVQRQATHIQPVACTYYYGFSISQPPFNNVLVRKAFIAATDRQGLIKSVTGGVQRPALTFTPPGIFGYVDGVAEGVGISYNPTQARQWLSDAGYPNGQGLPPVTLWYNTSTGHQAIANYIRNSWYATLGVSATLQSMPWSDYLTELAKGQFQVWRNGYCLDYPDANDFLNTAIIPSRSRFGNWTNATYDSLVDQAAREQDPNVRKSLYKQAEKILVETDAVMLPLYFYASVTASKPYLERTYPASHPHIADWRITRVSSVASPEGGGGVTSYDGDTSVQIPAGAITGTVVVNESPAYGMPPSGSMTGIGHVFDVSAVYTGTDPGTANLPAQILPGHTYTITVHYSDTEKGPAIENTLGLYWWDGSTWSQQGITSTVDITDNLVSAQVGHFSVFAVLGETKRVYLPVVLRN
jgi:oligopeptide transport system substrate-binding protein